MKLSEAEKEYYITLYNHGINHLVDDSIPNRVICVHNLHWILENLLRKATNDWQNIDYRDGFKEIFKKFCNKGSITVSPIIEEAIFDFNKIRNDMEHRQLFHDLNDIEKLIPKVRDFIKWIAQNQFNTEFNLHTISGGDESEIFKDFNDWMEKKLRVNYSKLEEDGENKIYDYIFICIIPTSYSSHLVNFSRDTVNELNTHKTENGISVSVPNPEYESKIEKYYNNLRHIFYGNHQIYTISPYFRYYEDVYGNEMRIYPDGRIYICFYYREFNPENPTFTLKSIIREDKDSYIIDSAKKKYGLNLETYSSGDLDNLLKIVCFPFTPECKVNLVNIPTNYFKCRIVLPNMKYEGKKRKFDPDNMFSRHRVYAGDEKKITFDKLYSYDQINNLVDEFVDWVYGFYVNPSSTAFS